MKKGMYEGEWAVLVKLNERDAQSTDISICRYELAQRSSVENGEVFGVWRANDAIYDILVLWRRPVPSIDSSMNRRSSSKCKG